MTLFMSHLFTVEPEHNLFIIKQGLLIEKINESHTNICWDTPRNKDNSNSKSGKFAYCGHTDGGGALLIKVRSKSLK